MCNIIAFMETLLQNSVAFGDHISSICAIREASAVICQRNMPLIMKVEANDLITNPSFQGIKHTGAFDELSELLKQELAQWPSILGDILELLHQFFVVVPTFRARLSFVAVRNGMCKKFHTDVTDYRLLCTYRGAGTQFIRPEKLSANTKKVSRSDVEFIKEGEVILFRGGMSATEEYPPLLHRSPEVHHPVEHRLLLRLDTNMTAWE